MNEDFYLDVGSTKSMPLFRVCIYFVFLVGESWTDNGASLLLWLVNCLILGFCMVKMFVYGDPVLPSKSKESLNFWRHRKQADDYLSKVHLTENMQCCFVELLFLLGR